MGKRRVQSWIHWFSFVDEYSDQFMLKTVNKQ